MKKNWQSKARMYPKYGGEPLPRPPIVMPYDLKGPPAKEYVRVLEKELNTGVDDGKPKWSGGERARIKRKLNDWIVKAHGLDPHYEKHGTNRRPFNAEPAGPAEWYQEVLRRREEDRTGVRVNSRARRDKFKISAPYQMKKIIRNLQKKFGTGTVEPKDD